MPDTAPPRQRRWKHWPPILAVAIAGVVTFLLVALLINISTRKQEERVPFTRVTEVSEISSDPVPWGMNWPRQFDSYKRTVDVTQTRYGGSSAIPQQKLDEEPWLKRLYAGYAFSIDYRERRGHAYMLYDQEVTERVVKKPQPGACLHCHASVAPTWRRIGAQALGQPTTDEALSKGFDWPAVMKGFETLSTVSYAEAHAELLKTSDGTPGENVPLTPGGSTTVKPTPANQPNVPPAPGGESPHAQGEAHPVSCVDCHDPETMAIRVTRPGFVRGIAALAESDAETPFVPSIARWREGSRAKPYDPNSDASRQELRTYVCAQCHVEYYCGPKTTLFFPWANGLKVEQIEAHYAETKFSNGEPFYDWEHGETGAHVYKAQHPEFELWSQGSHARAGVACADCHMPYNREGAMKVTDHWIRSPLLMVNRSCQTCHNVPEQELLGRVAVIQDRTHSLLARSSVALTDMLDAILQAKAAGVPQEELAALYDLQRSAQWRIDFVSSENSMGFHADQEAARILAEAMDIARQAQARALSLMGPKRAPAQIPDAPVQGVTPTDRAPPGPYKTQGGNRNTVSGPPSPPAK